MCIYENFSLFGREEAHRWAFVFVDVSLWRVVGRLGGRVWEVQCPSVVSGPLLLHHVLPHRVSPVSDGLCGPVMCGLAGRSGVWRGCMGSCVRASRRSRQASGHDSTTCNTRSYRSASSGTIAELRGVGLKAKLSACLIFSLISRAARLPLRL